MGLYTPFVGRLSFSCRPATTQAPLKRIKIKKGPGIENNLCFTTTNVSRRLGNNRQANTIVGEVKDGPVYPIRGPIIVQLPSSHYSGST